jgi:hypothetical protein
MNGEIYLALCERLKEVEAIKWIDFDSGQLSITGDRPPVAFPCCLIDLQYPTCRDTYGSNQLITLNIILKIGFQPRGDTYAAAPGEVRLKALEIFNVIEDVHRVMQGETLSDTVSDISRKRAVKVTRRDGIQVYTVTYETTFEECD